ncbi:hypothetical protein MTO96_040343, partial [Rhipicephalus appendiculatus]
MPRKSTGELRAHGSPTKATPPRDKVGGIEPSLGKVLTLTKATQTNGAAFKSTDSEKAKLKPDSSPGTPSVPSSEHGKPR